MHKNNNPAMLASRTLITGEAVAQQNQSVIIDNQVQSTNATNYYNAWVAEKAAREKLEIVVSQLQKQMSDFQKEITQNKEKCGLQYNRVEYTTDEEELTKETEWVVKESRKAKRKKMNITPDTSPTDKASTSKNTTSTTRGAFKKAALPPPIIVSQVKDYDSLKQALTNNNFNFKATMLNNDQIKLNVDDENTYRELTLFLSNGHQWHTYEDKHNRPLKVMVRRLHHTCKPESIVDELRNRGFKIVSAVNILKRREKIPLPFFMLTFEQGEDVKKVFGIEHLQGMKVQIEALRKSRIVPQCKRCQNFGHTQRFCRKEPRCVKCADKHETSQCTKNTTQGRTKCVNCGENHPANYRGCEVAKKMQKIKNEAIKGRQQKYAYKRVINQDPYVKEDKSYAQASGAKSTTTQPKAPSSVEDMLAQLIARFDQQEQLIKNQGEMIRSLSDRITNIESCSNRAAYSRR